MRKRRVRAQRTCACGHTHQIRRVFLLWPRLSAESARVRVRVRDAHAPRVWRSVCGVFFVFVSVRLLVLGGTSVMRARVSCADCVIDG